MLPQQTQTPYMPPPGEVKPEMRPPVTPPPAGPEYNDQIIETLAQRLMPRLMPEIMYNLRTFEPERISSRALGMSLALAIVSIGVMIPLAGIIVGVLGTASAVGGGVGPALIGLLIVGLVILTINIMYNYWLFSAKSKRE